MNRKGLFIFGCFLLLLAMIRCPVAAQEETESYETYQEIMMTTGKLLKNFTEEEMKNWYQEVQKPIFWGINVKTIHQNVETSYISSILYSVENRGESDVTYELDVVVETSNKTTWNVSGSLSGSTSGKIKSFKTDLAAKAGVEYSSVSSSSRKETQKMKVTVEKHSKAIVYLMGSARVTNGVCAFYEFFVCRGAGGFEYFTLVNQYPRLEKRSL